MCFYAPPSIIARLFIFCGSVFHFCPSRRLCPPQRRRRVGPSFYSSLDVKRVHRSFISSACLFPLEFDRARDYLIGKHISARLSLGSINHSI